MMYAITVQRLSTSDGWRSSVGLPTFFLSSQLQGIVSSDHAARIASRMLSSLTPNDRFVGTVTDEHGDDYATFDTGGVQS